MPNPFVLHIAPENTAGVPHNVMSMQNRFGFNSRLLTFYKIPFDFPEDICLKLTLPRGRLAMKWRGFKQSKLHQELDEQNIDSFRHMPFFEPKNLFEKIYLNLRELKNAKSFMHAIETLKVEETGIVHFDGGIDFFLDCRMAKKWKSEGKKIVNCYFGDDLRTRGVVKHMDGLSDLNLTFEYDHIHRHPNINFLFFPFDSSNVKYVNDDVYYSGNITRIVHSPTNRFIKGTEFVLDAIEKIKKAVNVEFVLLENLPREKVIELKSQCHIAIDQIGNRGGTGYGINSLESLSMGIPTVTDMNMGFDSWLTESPFIVADRKNLHDKLIELIDDIKQKRTNRSKLRSWVEKYHSYKSVFEKMNELYIKHKII